MKLIYTNRTVKKIIAWLLVVSFIIPIFPERVSANNSYDIETYTASMGEVTNLMPNTAQDWAIAYTDGLPYPGYFHRLVQERIRPIGMGQSELTIPGVGRADLFMKIDDLIYIWEVKPASYGYPPKYKKALNQINRYVNADESHIYGPNSLIQNGSFEVVLTSMIKSSPDEIQTVYKVTYQASLANDGLIFYRFDREGRVKQTEKVGEKCIERERIRATVNATEPAYAPVTSNPTLSLNYITV